MKYLFCFGILLFTSRTFAQQEQKADSVICFPSELNSYTTVLPELNRNLRSSEATATFETTYTDFPEEAKQAFEVALGIWSNFIVSRVPIRIKASWTTLTGNTLASSGATRVFKNFNGAVYKEVWYPVALAEAMAGAELNNKDFDINISLNKSINWSYNQSGRQEIGKYDLVTVVLHEITHGLGFTSSYKLTENGLQGQWGQSGTAYIYDVFVQNSAGVKLNNTGIFGNPSSSLKTELTGNNLFYGLTLPKYKDNLPRIYSPSTYREGGSISHLDESAYPPGNANSLMSPNVGMAEIIHYPGNITLAILNLMGWPVIFADAAVITANEPLTAAAGILIYPNPSDQQLNIYLPPSHLGEATTMHILDSQGKLVKQFTTNTLLTPSPSEDISSLASGAYFLRVFTGNQTQTLRFIKK